MEHVGRYRLVRRIGAGGMAEVFEGVAAGDAGFRRRVAVKRIMRGREADPSFVRMFLDEARIVSHLHHTHIVSILDFGIEDGQPYQVHEWVDGIDLQQAVDGGGPMPVELALHVCTRIGLALEYAHGAVDDAGHPLGIVHRDVTPGNILVSWAGDVKLGDFGIAHAFVRENRTASGMSKGKPAYMSPEQAVGAVVDHRADVFALGCVLHMLIAGESPLASTEHRKSIALGRPPPLASSLPPDVRDIVARALRIAPSDRFASAGSLAEALGSALASRKTQDGSLLLAAHLTRIRRQVPLNDPADLGVAGDGARSTELLGPQNDPDPPYELDAGKGDLDSLTAPTAPTRAYRPSQRSRSRRWVPWALAAVAILAGFSLIGAFLLDRASSASEGSASLTDAADAIATPSTPTADGPPPARASIVDASPPDDAADAIAVVPPEPNADGPAREPRIVSGRQTSSAAATSAAIGFIQIGGARAQHLWIEIDGQRYGQAPRSVSLPVGRHRVRLLTSDGRVAVSTILRVTTAHKAGAPLRWIVH